MGIRMEELDKLSFADVAEASTKSPTIAKDGRYSSFTRVKTGNTDRDNNYVRL